MRISDWSSDVCSSDLIGAFRFRAPIPKMRPVHICIIDLSVADCLGACRVNKIRVFMNVREILTLHAARVMNDRDADVIEVPFRSEEHTSELQSLMRISYAVFCLKNKNETNLDDKYK